MSTHPANGLDDTVHQRSRLGILAITQATPRVDFHYLQESLGVTAGNLSRHLLVLSEAGLIQVEKGYQNKRPRTWIHITRGGRQALRRELDDLKRIIATVEAANDAAPPSAGERRDRPAGVTHPRQHPAQP